MSSICWSLSSYLYQQHHSMSHIHHLWHISLLLILFIAATLYDQSSKYLYRLQSCQVNVCQCQTDLNKSLQITHSVLLYWCLNTTLHLSLLQRIITLTPHNLLFLLPQNCDFKTQSNFNLIFCP